jgi:hypothetical protein
MSLSMIFTLVAVGVLALVAAAALLVRAPGLAKRIEALFRKPRRPAKPPGPDHYYRPYWS